MNEIQKAIANARLAQKERIMGSFSNSGELLGDQEFEKARSGIYADTAENRKLSRVGQAYGNKKQDHPGGPSKGSKGDSEVDEEFIKTYKRMSFQSLEYNYNEVMDGTSKYKGAKANVIKKEYEDRTSGGFKDIKEGDKIKFTIDGGQGVEGTLHTLRKDKFVLTLTPKMADFWGTKRWTLDKDRIKSLSKITKKKKGGKIEKSDVMNALDQGNVKLSKSGKEIKEKANAALSGFLTEAATFKDLALRLLTECGSAPTKKVDYYWMSHLKLEPDLMIYDWDELYVPRENGLSEDTFSAQDDASKKKNRPENDEQAEARRDYNEQVREYCETLVDIRACEILVNNVKDGGSYELTPRQLIALNF